MRLVAQMAVKQQFGVRDRDYPYVANGGSFSVDPSLEVALSLLGDDYKIMSRDGDDEATYLLLLDYRKFDLFAIFICCIIKA